LPAIKDSQKWSRARDIKNVDADSKPRLVEAHRRRKTACLWDDLAWRSIGVGFARIGAFLKRNSRSTLGFFVFVHNARKRGKALFAALIEMLVS
jgi:hypothetical protein